MVSKVLELIRTRSNQYINLNGNGFNIYTTVNEGVKYFEDDLSDHTYFRAIIEISNKIEQVQPTGGLQNNLQNELQS